MISLVKVPVFKTYSPDTFPSKDHIIQKTYFPDDFLGKGPSIQK